MSAIVEPQPATKPAAQDKPTYKVAVGYLKRVHLCNEFVESLEHLRLVDDHPEGPHCIEHREMHKVGSYRVDRERNTVVEGLLRYNPPVDIVVLLDDDHQFTPSQFYQLCSLVSAERPVMSGLYFAVHSHDRNQPYVRPLLLRESEGGNSYETLWTYPKNELVAVDSIGLGFCAIWAPMLRAWQKEHGPTWFEFGRRPNGKHTLEDEAFSRKVRHEMGLPIYVHTGICTPHWKSWGFCERDYQKQIAIYEKENGTATSGADNA